MSEDGVKVIGVLIAIAVGCFLIYTAVTEFAAWFSAGGYSYFLYAVAIIAIPIILVIYITKFRSARRFAAMHTDGPMKVNITTSEVSKSALSNQALASGSKNWHRLHIDVKMSQKDYDALKRSGLEMHALFTHPHPRFPETQTPYRHVHLFNTPYVDFPSLQALDAAKEQLISGLHALRTRLDQMKEPPTARNESMEI